jgi:hypothetical protein
MGKLPGHRGKLNDEHRSAAGQILSDCNLSDALSGLGIGLDSHPGLRPSGLPWALLQAAFQAAIKWNLNPGLRGAKPTTALRNAPQDHFAALTLGFAPGGLSGRDKMESESRAARRQTDNRIAKKSIRPRNE